ncbi:MAG: hypothetical protein E7612_09065 [Ruminococcaceae bacterium]|nr:hypothetical protein [Oscillospiraceae bacterium]
MQENIYDCSAREKYFNEFNSKYPEFETGIIGRSILGKDIDYYKIGKGEKRILVVGAHHATDYVTSSALYGFVDFLCENVARGRVWNGINLDFLLRQHSYWIVPCINPDGVELNLRGLENSPLKERLLRMNGGSLDFSKWQSNARGVDLNRNYSFGFSEYKKTEAKQQIYAGKIGYSGVYPESEPETRAVSGFIRAVMPYAVVGVYSEGKEIYYRPATKRQGRIAEGLAALVGYEASAKDTALSQFGLVDYAGGVLGIPSFALKVGKGEKPVTLLQLREIGDSVRKFLIFLPTRL